MHSEWLSVAALVFSMITLIVAIATGPRGKSGERLRRGGYVPHGVYYIEEEEEARRKQVEVAAQKMTDDQAYAKWKSFMDRWGSEPGTSALRDEFLERVKKLETFVFNETNPTVFRLRDRMKKVETYVGDKLYPAVSKLQAQMMKLEQSWEVVTPYNLCGLRTMKKQEGPVPDGHSFHYEKQPPSTIAEDHDYDVWYAADVRCVNCGRSYGVHKKSQAHLYKRICGVDKGETVYFQPCPPRAENTGNLGRL